MKKSAKGYVNKEVIREEVKKINKQHVASRDDDQICKLLDDIIIEVALNDIPLESIFLKYRVSAPTFYKYINDPKYEEYWKKYKKAQQTGVALNNSNLLLAAKTALAKKISGSQTKTVTKTYDITDRGSRKLKSEVEKITDNDSGDLAVIKLVLDRLSESMSNQNTSELALKVFMSFHKFLQQNNPQFLQILLPIENQYLSTLIDDLNTINVDSTVID